MRLFSRFVRGAAAALALLAGAACEDELPTAGGDEQFAVLPTTIEVLLPASEFLLGDTVYRGFADPSVAPYLLVANAFDASLQAHALARITGFPDTITFNAQPDTAFRYVSGRVTTVIDDDASTPGVPVVLRLYLLDQPWDSASVSWERASATTPWRVPGGTPGRLLSEITWSPADTSAAADSVRWQIDSLAVRSLARDDSPGLLVTSGSPGTRVQFTGLTLQATIRPSARADTTVTQTVFGGHQTFVFTPAPPTRPGILSVGGATGERSVLRLNLARSVPTCPPGSGSCPTVPLRQVTLNRATLLLDPVAVPGGFRPLGTAPVSIRRLLEPELGRRAPLGEVLAGDTVPAASFLTPSGPVAFDVTSTVNAYSRDAAGVTIALLGAPEGGSFGYAWFTDAPRLRLVYTLPLTPSLP